MGRLPKTPAAGAGQARPLAEARELLPSCVYFWASPFPLGEYATNSHLTRAHRALENFENPSDHTLEDPKRFCSLPLPPSNQEKINRNWPSLPSPRCPLSLVGLLHFRKKTVNPLPQEMEGEPEGEGPVLPSAFPAPKPGHTQPRPLGSAVLSVTRTCRNFMAPGTLNSEARDRLSEVMRRRSDLPPAPPYKSRDLGRSAGGAGSGEAGCPLNAGAEGEARAALSGGLFPWKRLGAEGQLQESVFTASFRASPPPKLLGELHNRVPHPLPPPT